MKTRTLLLILPIWACQNLGAQIGSVGINTNTPQAMLHLKDSSVLFSAPFFLNMPELETPPPASGVGTRLMWYPQKHAFRAGGVEGTQWNQQNIGVFSFAVGINTTAAGAYSSAMGRGTAAHGASSLVIGQYNDPVVSPQTVVMATTPLFLIGNGDAADDRSNAMIVRKDGNIGIGTNNPSDKLHINALTGEALRVQVNSSTKLRVMSNGGTAIGSASIPPVNGLRVAGQLEPVGGIVSASDPIRIESTTDSIEIKSGSSRIIVYAGGAIKILASGGNDITIDAGTGDIIMKGQNVDIEADSQIDVSASGAIEISSSSAMDIIGLQVRLNGGTTPVAKFGSTVTVTGSSGVISGNVSSSVFTQ